MRAVWTQAVPEPFVIRSVQALMPELAYTTVMTTVNRLAEKGLLTVRRAPQQRAYEYRAARTPEQFLVVASRVQVEEVIRRFGDTALAAFADHLKDLTPAERERLRRAGSR